jgi:archaetidylserine synthase
MNILQALRIHDIFSFLNSILGFGAMLAASNGEAEASAALVIFAAIADGADGIVARRIGPGPLGEDLDSLADMISFGAAPAFLAITNLGLGWSGWILGGLYLICGATRLARFNVSQKNDNFFEGFPIPAAGIFLVGTILFGIPDITIFVILSLSILMISSIHYPKVRDSKLSIPLGFFLFVISCVLLTQFSNQSKVFYANIILFAVNVIYLCSPVVIRFLRIER